MEFARVEPFGPIRDNIHAAIIAQTVTNMLRGRNTAPVGFDPFILRDAEDVAQEKKRHMINFFKALAVPK